MHLNLCPGVVRWDGLSSEGSGEAFHLRVCNLASPLLILTDLALFSGGMIKDLHYLCIEDLLALDSCREYADPSHLVVSREIPPLWTGAHGQLSSPITMTSISLATFCQESERDSELALFISSH